MYKTEPYNGNSQSQTTGETQGFDWEMFFSGETAGQILQEIDPRELVLRIRDHLKENKFRLTLTFNQLMRKLFKGREPKEPQILELGAATGFLTRWLTEEYGGKGVLVDNSEASYHAFNTMTYDLKENLTYIKADLFQLQLETQFDLVCSFGLIEHFREKEAVLEIHKKFVTPEGYIIISVPMDTPLTRTFFEVHPEQNLGYRELLKERELRTILTRNGLTILNIQTSSGYCYDILAALCQIETKNNQEQK